MERGKKVRTRGGSSRVLKINVWEVRTVRSTRRRTAIAVGFFALSSMGVPVLAQSSRGTAPAQRGGAPNADTPQILVAAFAGPSQTLGVEVADEVRSRIQGEHSAKDLYAVTKTNINNALVASGYRP